MKTRSRLSVVVGMVMGLVLGVLLVNLTSSISAQRTTVDPATLQIGMGTAISYQGRLNVDGNPANGTFDFEFKLYESAIDGNQIGDTVLMSNVSVVNGLFTVYLDFGNVFSGEARYLGIGVRPGGATDGFTTLSPRQMLAAVPYALHSVLASQAISATFAQTATYATTTDHAMTADSAGEALNATHAQTATRAMTATHALNVPPETWRSSNTVVVTPLGIEERVGAKVVGTGDRFYSHNRKNQILGFAPPVTEKRIESIDFIILSKTGSYESTFTLTFEVRDLDGNLQHIVSAASIDLKTAPVRVWNGVSLSSTPADLVVSPGEYLAVRISRGGEAGGDPALAISPAFEVKVRDSTQ